MEEHQLKSKLFSVSRENTELRDRILYLETENQRSLSKKSERTHSTEFSSKQTIQQEQIEKDFPSDPALSSQVFPVLYSKPHSIGSSDAPLHLSSRGFGEKWSFDDFSHLMMLLHLPSLLLDDSGVICEATPSMSNVFYSDLSSEIQKEPNQYRIIGKTLQELTTHTQLEGEDLIGCCKRVLASNQMTLVPIRIMNSTRKQSFIVKIIPCFYLQSSNSSGTSVFVYLPTDTILQSSQVPLISEEIVSSFIGSSPSTSFPMLPPSSPVQNSTIETSHEKIDDPSSSISAPTEQKPTLSSDSTHHGSLLVFFDCSELNEKSIALFQEPDHLYGDVPVGLCHVDQRRYCIRANEKFSLMVGLSKDACVGKTLQEILPSLNDRLEPAIKSVFNNKLPVSDLELCFPSPIEPSELEITWLACFYPVFADHLSGKSVISVGIVLKDVTVLKGREYTLLREKQRVEQATKAKSRFLANVSHELRTPMACVIGMVDFLFDTELNAEQYDYANTIRQSAVSLLQLLNDVLDLSKVEAGKLMLEPINFDLFKEIEKLISVLAFKISEKKLELLLNFDFNMERLYWGDPGRIRQICMNVVGNAIKFTEKGFVMIEVRPLLSSTTVCDETSSKPEKHGILIRVTDSGMGIPESARNKIFEEFEQARGGTSNSIGSGLGLTISRHLVSTLGNSSGGQCHS